MGMPALITATGTGTSAIWFPDWMQNPFNIDIQAILPASATATFNVEHTLDNIEVTQIGPFSGNANATTAANANWIVHPTINAATGNIAGTYSFPVRAIRVNILSCSATGFVSVTFIQATNFGY